LNDSAWEFAVFIIGLLNDSINKQIEENARQNDETAKYTMKRQFDERNHTKPCDIQIGNSVLRKTDSSSLVC
jgi:hypothetical protein